jgi:hypothetical protein
MSIILTYFAMSAILAHPQVLGAAAPSKRSAIHATAALAPSRPEKA